MKKAEDITGRFSINCPVAGATRVVCSVGFVAEYTIHKINVMTLIKMAGLNLTFFLFFFALTRAPS